MSSISIISSSNFVPSAGPIQGMQPVTGADPDGDGDGGGKVRGAGQRGHGGGHGGGAMQSALLQALQNLGFSAAQVTGSSATTATSATNAASATSGTSGVAAAGGGDSDGDNDGSGNSTASASGSTPSGIKADLAKFMHALFQAVKNETAAGGASGASSGNSGSTATATDPKTRFANGLSALISQVGSGNAPSDLQNAFNNVLSDLQGSSATGTNSSAGTGSGSGSDTSSGSSASAQVSLQALLSQLQQNLGYGAASANVSLGSLVNHHA